MRWHFMTTTANCMRERVRTQRLADNMERKKAASYGVPLSCLHTGVSILQYHTETYIVGRLPCKIRVADICRGIFRTAVPCAAAYHLLITLRRLAPVGVGCIRRPCELAHVAVHIVEASCVGLILGDIGNGHSAVVDTILARHESIVFVYPAALRYGLRIDTRYSHTAQ